MLFFRKNVFLVLLFSLMVLLSFKSFLVSPNSADNLISSNNVLIIYDNTFDAIISETIIENEPTGNYTLISSKNVNLEALFEETDLNTYSSVFLILSTSINDLSEEFYEKILSFLEYGSLGIISSKVWQLPISTQESLGIISLVGGFQEFSPNPFENFTLTVQNEDFLQEPYQYSTGEFVTSSAKLGMINKGSGNVSEILISENFNIGQNKSISSGIYLKTDNSSSNLALTIPMSIQYPLDNESLNMIGSLSHYLINQSFQRRTSVLAESDNLNTITTLYPKLDLNTPEIQVIVGIGGGAIIGVSSYKLLTSLRKRDEEEKELFLDDQDIWSPDTSIFSQLIALILGFFAKIGAIIYSQRYSRLTLFHVKDNPIRKEIIDILEKTEFEHFNSLQKQLKTGVSILLWHLKVLEDFKLVKMDKIGQFKIIYLIENPPDPEEVYYYCNIRTEIAIRILDYFTKNIHWSIESLSQLLATSQELAKYHCNKLVKMEILHYNKATKNYSFNTQKLQVSKQVIKRYQTNGDKI